MALADILERIEADAAAESAQVADAARSRADAILAAAKAKAEAHVDEVVSAARIEAARDAETTVVNARLRGRDALVTARRALIDETLAAAAESIAGLPDDAYASFLAARIAVIARGGETLAFGSEDSGRAELVMRKLEAVAPNLSLTAAPVPAPFARGALLQGDRVRADLSLGAIVDERRDEFEAIAANELFGKEE